MRLQGAVDIRATTTAVFGVLSTPERLPEWNPSVARAQRVGGGPVALGSRAIFAGRLLGQELESETEVVGFDPPRWFATRAVRGPRLRTSFRLEPVALGTRVAAEVEGEVPGGKLGGFVVERLLRADFYRSLDQLQALCEAEARRAADGGPLAR
jgi:Polyketide cyclase / dehydrase and lipid transport